MAYEQKPGTGSIFRNEYKTSDNHPEYRGSVIAPDGKKWDASLWVKRSQAGKPYFSVSLQEPYKKEASSSANFGSAETSSTLDVAPSAQGVEDDLPF